MSDTEYGAALKLGKKQYQDSVAKGEYPYLPVLDEALSYTDIVSQVSLGTMDIPLSKLVGTKTAERSISFANNFMPLLTERSEFAIKWQNLYNYQVEDGINDPIVAYEFMNRFYVQEGNKRVSVMKYLGAYSIPGTVIRQVVQPKLVGDSLGLNPILTLLFLYLGFKLKGIAGMILAVPCGMFFVSLYNYGAFRNITDSLKELADILKAFMNEK